MVKMKFVCFCGLASGCCWMGSFLAPEIDIVGLFCERPFMFLRSPSVSKILILQSWRFFFQDHSHTRVVLH
ncbi:hypothetical protein ERO13_A05G215850v2 [Gossypium hirsutum]|uniref:Secreted protein n=3 Tax=Gossypium TaxID=3633 RepID=A0A5J5VST0_GOSBA|nr:hypothetical protein ES319_A05G224800v1 [Gossypium barbadense]KAG4200501.1 hypothetical protein ERO13_A05G215850v2 [Gossypium hirsutum]TYH17923.1 hypothetical protein ES288_A05G230100v1 [Gossypium darwinii]TYJ35341.1 hypothetical protein E1A91_A05G230600v1 [Gossypium mustelinum]